MTRTCRVCLTSKELEEFPKAAHGKDGRRNQCTECRKAYHRINSKKHYARTRTEKLVKVKAYNVTHSEIRKEYNKAWRQLPKNEGREKLRSQLRRQHATPDEKRHRAFLTRRYLARKLNAPGYCTRVQLQARWDYYGGKCWICVNEAKEMDHVKPLTKGGSNWPANLRPICRSCNARKSNSWPYKPLSKEQLPWQQPMNLAQ